MNYPIIFLIFAMSIVTYLPRALPAVVIGRLKFSPTVEKFMRLIPYTAMAALIFPGIVTVDAARPEIGIVGGAVAGILAWLKCPVVVCAISAVVANMLLYLVF